MNNQKEDMKMQRRQEAKAKIIELIDQYHGGFIDRNDIKATFDGMIELYDESLNQKVIPKFQFTEDGRPVSGISDIILLLESNAPISGEAKCSFFLNPLFDTRIVIDILKHGNEEDLIILKREASLFLIFLN